MAVATKIARRNNGVANRHVDAPPAVVTINSLSPLRRFNVWTTAISSAMGGDERDQAWERQTGQLEK